MTDQKHERQWDVRFGRIAGYEWGLPGKNPTIIALHGWLDNASSFLRVRELLPEMHIIAPDLPGHGKSDWLPRGADYSIWSSIDALYDVVASVDGPVVILGHSMGGAIGLLFAGAFPDLVSGYIALDSIGPVTTEAKQSPRQLAEAVQHRGNRPARSMSSEQQAIDSRLKLAPTMTADAIRPIVQRNLQENESAFTWKTDPRLRLPSKVRLTEEQVAAFIEAITCPALILRASHGIIPDDAFRRRLAFFTRAKTKVVQGHHHLHIEQQGAEDTASLVRQFMEELA
jgi:pimeloyl-ACP methyl ester carboxylesterase